MSTEAASAADGVHRLLDMVVEEVSLVDRAANKHRFLVVKRDDAMDEDTLNKEETDDEAAPEGDEPEASDDGTAPADDGAFAAALAALQSLTAIVELLGELGAGQADARLATLAEELRAAADQMLKRAGGTPEPSNAESLAVAEMQNAETAPSPPPLLAPPASPMSGADVLAVKQALSRLSALLGAVPPAATQKQAVAPTPPAASSPNVTEYLTKLTASLDALTSTVREQQQRLGRVEKQFGLPNSAPPAEHVSKATTEEVGWPLDLNRPMGREHVDKAVSFHDL